MAQTPSGIDRRVIAIWGNRVKLREFAMFNPDANAPPLNPLPPVVILLVILMVSVEAMFQLGEAQILGGAAGPAWRILIADQFGFSNAAVYWMWDTGQYPLALLIRFVSYPFVHANFGSALFSVVFVLALGKFVGDRVSSVVFLLIFFGSAIVAALVQVWFAGPTLTMLGAGAASYGLIGALSWILFTEQREAGENGLKAFRLIASLAVLLGVFFALFGGSDWFERMIGFLVGFAICLLMRPKAGAGLGYWVKRLRVR
jgi:rhomboid protease GluP